jgi:choline dehydrogenase
LEAFPDDWPELEYLSVGGYIGDSVNSAVSTPSDGYNYISVVAALVAPLSRGTVSISSANTADPPVIDPRWLTDPTDQAVAIAGYKRLRQLFATNALKPVLIGPEYYPGASVGQSDQQLLAEIKKGFQTIWHAACTCKMGKSSDPMAVVDSQARVFGVKGLRVVDASAFALLPAGHPMSTVCKCSS